MLQRGNSPLATGHRRGMRGRSPLPRARCTASAQEAKALKPDASGPAKGPKNPGFQSYTSASGLVASSS